MYYNSESTNIIFIAKRNKYSRCEKMSYKRTEEGVLYE